MQLNKNSAFPELSGTVCGFAAFRATPCRAGNTFLGRALHITRNRRQSSSSATGSSTNHKFTL
jgi:hypothetical protein